MIPFTPDDRRAQFAPSQNVGGAVDRDVLDIIGAQSQPTMAAQVDYDVPDIKPVDPDVVDIVNQSQVPLMSSLMGASRVNPDQAAEANRIGSQIGVGQDIALRNMDEVRQRAFMAEVQRRDIARANPVLAGFLTDRTFANEASDDIGTLDRVGSFFADIGRAAAGRPMEYTAGELVRGYVRGQLVAERGEIGTRAILGEAEETNFARAKQIQQEMRDLTGGGILASTAEVVAQNVAQAREVVGAGLIGGAAGSVVPGIGTMTGFAGGLGTGIVLTTAKMEAGNLYLDLQEQGISDDTAVPIAVGAGLLNGVIEVVGMKIAAAPFRQLASRVMREQIAEAVRKPTMRAALAEAGKAYVVQVGSEAAEEGLQEIVNIAGEELARGMEGIDSETTMRDAAKRVLDSFVQGAMGGAILGGVGPGANLYVDLRRAGKATKQTQFFDDLSKNATESKLKARDPGAYERFVAATADGTGAETVFVDGATMRDVLTQAGITDAQLEAIVPGVAQQVRQAAELGNDVTLPTAQFAGRLAGTPLGDALLPHMRLSPDAMSAMEAQQFAQSREALVEEARALLEAKTEAESAFVQEADQVFSSMRERLVAAGRDPALADIEALMHQAFVVTQAANRGMTPAQFEAESGLREIVGAEMPAAPIGATVPTLEQANRDIIESVDAELGGIMDAAKKASRAAGQTKSKDTQAAAFKAKQEWIAENQERYAEYQAAQRFDALERERIREAAESALAGKIDESLATAAKTLTDVGFVLDYESVAPSKSRYYRKGNTLIRLSDHEIPVTPERGAAREAGVQVPYRDFVFDGTAVDAELIQDLQEFAARTSPNIMEQAARLDADYVAAVERGDMDAAQRMVDDAAYAAGFTIEAFHGTPEGGFTEFRDSPRGLFFTNKKTLAAGYTYFRTPWLSPGTTPTVYRTRLRMQNPLRIDAGGARNNNIPFPGREYNRTVFGNLPAGAVSVEEAARLAFEQGHDGIIIGNVMDGVTMDDKTKSTVYVIPTKEQVKSADPVTYDEAGNVIPLSRRFDITSPRIFEQASRLDADYVAAVERGDMEAAQRMVDDAAYAAGYTVRAFHGTDAKPFDIFGNYDAYNFGDASYFSPDRKYAEDYAYSQRTGGGEPRVLNVALKLGRVFSPETNKQHLAMYKKWAKEQPAMHGYFAVQGPVKEPYGPDGVRNLINWEDQWWLVNKIREAGFDSFTTSESDGQTIAYGVLNANQIKLADPVTRDESGNVVPLSRRFDITSPRIFEQAPVAPGFYSALEREITAIDAKALTAAGWGERLKGSISKGAIKADELEWSGLNDYLKMQDGNVSKDAVLEFLRGNGVRVERVGFNILPAAFAAQQIARDAFFGALRERYGSLVIDGNQLFDDDINFGLLAGNIAVNQLPQDLQPLAQRWLAASVAKDQEREAQTGYRTRYGEYTLRGGTNYREILLTLPSGFQAPAPAVSPEGLAAREAIFAKYAPELAELEREGNSLMFAGRALTDEEAQRLADVLNERDELEERRNAKARAAYKIPERPAAPDFQTNHWEQRNVLVHLRMNDRVDADGKRVLFVEEVQSDWGQAGVKYGFANQRAADEAELAELLAQQEANPTDARKKQIARVRGRITRGEYNVFRAPYVETTGGWLNLGLKQIMLEAVRGGYDRVAFVNGEQSADRYDLSKRVESLSWTGYASRGATKLVSIYPKQGNAIELPLTDSGVVVSTGNQYDGKALDEIVPKEIADQIMGSRSGELAGKQLEVGGEGMRAFYDNIVPAAMGKLLKKYGGGKLGQVGITEQGTMRSLSVHSDETQYWLEFYDGTRASGNVASYLEAVAIRKQLESAISKQPGFDITPELVKKLESGLPLFQAMPAAGPARGGYDPSRLKILFGKGADFTTGAHELTHYYVDYYTKQAMAGTAAPQMLADLDAMFKFMGVAGDTPEARLAAFNAMPFETARPLIEAITYNAEVYLFEGKAPSLELAGVFDRMLAFFRRAYKSLADFVTQQQEIYRREFGRELPALNDDLRAVFDRMLADERQIKQAQAVAQMRGQFTVKPEGMDDAEWAAYQEMAGEATNAAIADMTKASLRQMEWLSRARNRIVKELQARHTAQRKEVRERVQKDVQQEPLYRAMAFLRRGQVVAPDGTVTEAEGVHKIDRVLAAEFAPTVDLAALGGRYGVLQDDGLHPDIVAEMFGYPTGGTLLEALAAAKPMREAVEDRTDAEMLRLYGEMNTPEAREQEIQKALHNEARARLVGVELRFMGNIQQPVRVLMEAARQAAQQVIDRKRVGELRPSEFVAAEAKASREATAAMQDNKPDMAVRAKRAQLLNNQLAKAALEVKDEIDTDIRYLRRVLRDSNRQRMGADVADQIASLLDRFNIAPMTADEARRVGTLAEFLASLEDRGLVPDIAEAIGMRDTRIPYKNMTIGEFRELVDAVKQLEYVGKNERKILLAKEKAEFGAVRDQIVASVIENAGDRKANARTATTNIGRAVTAMKGFAAAHLKAASIVRILDGGKDGGPLWNYLIRSANEAGDSETSMRAEATADLTKILEPVFRAGKLGGKGVFYPSINRSLNREARLVVALNMGNAGNMQRLLDGEGWSMEAVMPVLQSLTEDELNTVQQIWDYFEKYRPMIGQKERRLYGKEPSWVEPQPLVVLSADGKTVTLRGGYYPIKYDPRASLRAETMSEADEAKRDLAGAYTTATTRRSFVKARVRKVEGRPLLYTLAGMYGGINDVIHDLTWHEWLIQANRLMRSNSFDDAVRNRYGPEYVTQLKNWIKDVAAGERGVQNEAEMALNFLRQGISSAGLGFNIVSAAMQITGFNQSIVRVGARWIGRGIAYVAQNPMVAMREVNEKSEFMRNRSRTQFRELNEIRNMVQGQSVAMRRVQMGTYFLMMRMQRMVDVPTWHGAYEKAMYEGRDEETAIALADQAVIDSQGGGMVKDLARVERGGPAVKLFTVFYGYMNTVYNMAAVQTMTNKNKGKLAADYAMLFVVPVVLSYMLKQALIPRKGDEEEEWDMGKIGRELAAEQLSYLMGTMVIAREFGEVGKMIFGVEGPRMGYGGPAGLRAIGETYQFATQASQGEFDTAFRKSAVNMIGAFTGLPSAQVNRTLDGLEALYEGETKNVLAPLTGAKKR